MNIRKARPSKAARQFSLITAILCWSVCQGWAQGAGKGRAHWQLLDEPPVPVFEIGVGSVGSGDLDGAGSYSVIEADAASHVAYFRDMAMADIVLNVEGDLLSFSGSGGVEHPKQLGRLALDAAMCWRFVNQSALRVGTKPGIYADLEEFSTDALAMPVSIEGIFALRPDLATSIGLEIRPGFERRIFPLIGVGWKLSEMLRFDGVLPRSRLSVNVIRDLTLYGQFEWNSMTYAVSDDADVGRNAITIEDSRAAVGISYSFDPEFTLAFEIGRVFDRSVEFSQAGPDAEYDLDSALTYRVAFIGPF